MTRSRSTSLLLVTLMLLVALCSWLLGNRSVAAPASAAAETPTADRAREGVLVSATGEVLGVPDTLRANFAVGSSASTVDGALNGANAAMTRMRDALVRGGVAKADLQTSNADIHPSQSKEGRVTGYAVNEGLTAKIRNIRGAGTLIGTAVAAGGNAARLSGVSFAVETDDALLAAARKKAFADARAKAQLYAAEAGRSLGPVVSVTETMPGYEPARAASLAYTQAAAGVPIEPGRQQLAVTVTVEWSFR
jgi:uncharacterized protein YggE